MQTSSSFLQFSKWVLVMVFLVILAGAVVRTTQSGMGCPDWPKCFGQYIPPTKMEQVLFGANKNYTKGQFIRYNDSLWFAAETFTSSQNFDKVNWQHYNKHGYTKIVIYQTWIEYINRLLGALLGLFILAQLIWSLKFWKVNKRITWLCLVNVLLTGFQAWLGKKVVDANLAGVKITTHMLVALLIAAVALTIIYSLTPTKKIENKKLYWLTLTGLVLLTVQIVLGTQVREQIDEISKSLSYGGRDRWIDGLDNIFLIHRSFSLVVTGICLYVVVGFKKVGVKLFSSSLIIVCLFAEIILGIIMAYFDVPAIAQPLHLLFSSVLFVSLFYSWLNTGLLKAA
jgi:cytochrome c oxidase assembly protein subunit 15